jgi:hypothetical protein
MNQKNTATRRKIKQRRTRRRTTQRCTQTMKSQKIQKKKFDICENHLFKSKEKEIKDAKG